MSDCPLCAVVANDSTERVVHRDGGGVAFIHSDWSVRGHVVVVAPRHVENLSDLEEGEALRFLASYRAVEKAVLEVTGARRAVIMKLGLAVPHLHLHVYPTWDGDDRATVFARIDSAVVDGAAPEERERFAEALRSRLSR